MRKAISVQVLYLRKRRSQLQMGHSRVFLDEEVQAGARHFRGGERDVVSLVGPDRTDVQVAQ